MLKVPLLLLAVAIGSCLAFGGGEDRFVRKYAMMKVYESCFGQELVKEIRKEMRAACAKCAALSSGSPQEATPEPATPDRRKTPAPQFDPAKLQQAILGFKHSNPMMQSPVAVPPQFPAGYYPAQPMYYPGANSLYTPYSPVYPGQPIYPQQQQPAYYPGYYPTSNHRASRDLDLRSQLESLTSRIGGRVRNMTCVMQELGYLNDNLEPNYQRIVERISKLPIGEELKKDMVEGVDFCQKFSQCVPEMKKDKLPLSRELMKPMFFFRCYKHKKLEACVMKDIRERYQSEDLSEDDQDMAGGELRSFSGQVDEEDQQDMAGAMYDFLMGAGGLDGDALL